MRVTEAQRVLVRCVARDCIADSLNLSIPMHADTNGAADQSACHQQGDRCH
ncbi:MAG: hypothetical protein NVSMB48_18950 [Marmoricola sp.]